MDYHVNWKTGDDLLQYVDTKSLDTVVIDKFEMNIFCFNLK